MINRTECKISAKDWFVDSVRYFRLKRSLEDVGESFVEFYYHDCLLFYFSEQMSTTSALLLLDDERKAQLDLLNQIDQSGTKDFPQMRIFFMKISFLAAADICNAALGYLSTGLSAKSITSAASRFSYLRKYELKSKFFVDHLQLDVDTVRATIESLLWLYTECAKTKISAEALDESLKLLGFSTPIRQSFIQCYLSKASQLQTTLATDLALSLPHYKNLSWRFDVQVSFYFQADF